MTTLRTGRPLLQAVVEVDVAGGCNPRSFRRRYEDRFCVDAELERLIETEREYGSDDRAQLGYHVFTQSQRTDLPAPLIPFWQALCLFERDLRGATDPTYNPLVLTEHTSLFPMRFSQLGPQRLDRPTWIETSRLIVVTREPGRIHARTVELMTKAFWPSGTYQFSGR